MIVTIPTDVGNLVLDESKARSLLRELKRQLDIEDKVPPITPAMLAAGVSATHLNLGYPKKFLPSELEGIVRRVYIAMRELE